MKKIELGDEVRHKYSGFKGIAVCRSTYLSGCDRITIMPKTGKDGKLGDNCSFDEPEIEIIKKGKAPKIKEGAKTGGFQPEYKHCLK